MEIIAERTLVAVCGKGGVGKTVFTALAARALVESGKAGRLLLIDADPAMGLPIALGIEVTRTMGQVREEIIQAARKNRREETTEIVNMLDYMALEALTETGEFALLAMGRSETLGCYCPVNDLLRATIGSFSQNFDTTLIDGEAGLEQLNRQVMRDIGTLVVVSDPTSRGLQTASLIRTMVQVEHVIRCQRIGLVFNRVQVGPELLEKGAQEIGLKVFGYVPQDTSISEFDLIGKPITGLPGASPALDAVRRIVEEHILHG